MTDERTDGPSRDINDIVESEWIEETTPFERIWTVIRTTHSPQSAQELAERARTDPDTTQAHLTRLVSSGIASAVAEVGDMQETVQYRRSVESLVVEQASDLLEQVSADTLASQLNVMRGELEAYRDELGADSPADAAVRGLDIDPVVLQEWQTTRRNYHIAKAALAIHTAVDALEETGPADLESNRSNL